MLTASAMPHRSRSGGSFRKPLVTRMILSPGSAFFTSMMYSYHIPGSLYVNAIVSRPSCLHMRASSSGDSYVVRFLP